MKIQILKILKNIKKKQKVMNNNTKIKQKFNKKKITQIALKNSLRKKVLKKMHIHVMIKLVFKKIYHILKECLQKLLVQNVRFLIIILL